MHASAVSAWNSMTDFASSGIAGIQNALQPIISLATGRITGFEALTALQRGGASASAASLLR